MGIFNEADRHPFHPGEREIRQDVQSAPPNESYERNGKAYEFVRAEQTAQTRRPAA